MEKLVKIDENPNFMKFSSTILTSAVPLSSLNFKELWVNFADLLTNSFHETNDPKRICFPPHRNKRW